MNLRGKVIGLLALAGSIWGCASSGKAPIVRDLSVAQSNADLSLEPTVDQATPMDLAVNYDLALCPSCDDNIPCTVDVCLSLASGCQHLLDHSRCPDEQLCTVAGCVDVDRTKVCANCSSDSDCSSGEVCGDAPGADGGTAKFCLPTCVAAVGCPKGFACDNGQTPPRCQPQTICCIDSDGDQHGYGAGCLGPDCDDHDRQSFNGNPEVCDGRDNDCNGLIDDGYLCGGPVCGEVGSSGLYQGTPTSVCTRGSCTDEVAAPCGSYTCSPMPTPVPGSVCLTNCPSDDAPGDNSCITASYCDGANCSDRLPDGQACDRARECQSNHCQNGYCCLTGDCCASSGNCPGSYARSPTCGPGDLTQCQGTREDASCVNAICGSVSVDDDSGCNSSVTKTCTPYPQVSCTGASSQGALVCAMSCGNMDSGCADQTNQWCSYSAGGGTCVGKLPDGSACDAGTHGNDQCISGHHCLNGYCCNAASGYCCNVAGNCPASLAQAAVCDAPLTSCQGHRVDRTCVTSICGSATVADDSACSTGVSLSCGNYKPVTCNGASSQNGLVCPSSCSVDTQCTAGNHCYGGHCVPWVNNGGGCQSSAQCLSGNCWNGSVCCSSACNNTTCDTCWGGSCSAYSDSQETTYCGDPNGWLGSGQFTTDVYATIQNAADSSDWYYLYATDGDNACFWPFNDYGHMIVTLDMPAGVDYDLYLYRYNCTNLIGSSTNGTGVEDRVDFQESCGGDDSGWYYIEVRRFASYSCSQDYHLNVSAHL